VGQRLKQTNPDGVGQYLLLIYRYYAAFVTKNVFPFFHAFMVKPLQG